MTRSTDLTRLRAGIGVIGVATVGFGGWLAVSSLGLKSLRLALWLAIPVVLHDGVLVPAVLAIAWIGRRVLPRPVWGPAAVGLTVTGTLTALAGIALVRPGPDPMLPSLLNRNYWAGYGTALVVVWALTATVAVVRVRRYQGKTF